MALVPREVEVLPLAVLANGDCGALDDEVERQVLRVLDDVAGDADEIVDHHGDDGTAAVAEARHHVAIAGLPADDADNEEVVA